MKDDQEYCTMQCLKAATGPFSAPKEKSYDRQKEPRYAVRTKRLVTFWLTSLCNKIKEPWYEKPFHVSATVDDKEALQ